MSQDRTHTHRGHSPADNPLLPNTVQAAVCVAVRSVRRSGPGAGPARQDVAAQRPAQSQRRSSNSFVRTPRRCRAPSRQDRRGCGVQARAAPPPNPNTDCLPQKRRDRTHRGNLPGTDNPPDQAVPNTHPAVPAALAAPQMPAPMAVPKWAQTLPPRAAPMAASMAWAAPAPAATIHHIPALALAAAPGTTTDRSGSAPAAGLAASQTS